MRLFSIVSISLLSLLMSQAVMATHLNAAVCVDQSYSHNYAMFTYKYEWEIDSAEKNTVTLSSASSNCRYVTFFPPTDKIKKIKVSGEIQKHQLKLRCLKGSDCYVKFDANCQKLGWSTKHYKIDSSCESISSTEQYCKNGGSITAHSFDLQKPFNYSLYKVKFSVSKRVGNTYTISCHMTKS